MGRINNAVMQIKDADGMTNSVSPDQTASAEPSHFLSCKSSYNRNTNIISTVIVLKEV